MGKRLFFVLLLCALVAGPTACGGGGDSDPGDGDPGGDTGSPALFSGGYWYSEMRIHASPLTVMGVWGAVNADGVGQFLNQTRANSNGDSANAPTTRTDAYDVSLGRNLRWTEIGGNPFAYGGISSAGDLAALAKYPDGLLPGLVVLTRMSGTFVTSDLGGMWHGCDFIYGYNLDIFQGSTGVWTFDSVGAYSMQGITNHDGNATNPYNWGGGAFTVASEGQVEAIRPNGEKTVGQLSTDKRFLALSGALAENDSPKLQILVRQADGTLTAASLQGTYLVQCLLHDVSQADYASGYGRMEFDGTGNYTMRLEMNFSTGGAASRTVSGTYTVAGNGRFTVTEAGAGAAQYQGGLSQDGRYAVLGGGISDGSDPSLYFLLK